VARADQAQSSTHVVEPGETLSGIANALGVDSAALVTLNGLDDADFLAAGQPLNVPARSAAGTPPASAGTLVSAAPPRTLTVVEGDTLWGIAQRFGTTAAALAQANGLVDADRLALGTELALPAGATANPETAAPANAPADAAANAAAVAGGSPAQAQASAGNRGVQVSYTVKRGETLSQLARQFGVRADAIARASGLADADKLTVGAVLKVPLPAKEHVVAAGETLRDIALEEKVDLGSLVDFNQLDDPALIRVGQVVLLPLPATVIGAAGGAAASSGPSVAAAAAQSPDKPGAPAAAATAPSAPTQRPSAASKAPPPVAVVAPPPGAPRDGLVGAALKLLGSPYAWGGSSPNGFDCSGFVWYVARQAGKSISRGLLGQYNSGAHPAREELKPGDLVFFQNTYKAGPSHNGVYIGDGRFVSAADEGAGVAISSLGTPYWTSHWFGATRLP
jgi:cell wall-associated NlpC family hydrolase